MPDFRVTRSFAGNTRGKKVTLSADDAKVMLEAGYVAEIRSSEPKAPRKRAAKKTAKTPEPAPEVAAES